MTVDWMKPVQTRDGYPIRVFCFDRVAPSDGGGPIVGMVTKDGYGYVRSWFVDGRQIPCRETCEDAINVPVKHEGYLNVYRHNNGSGEPAFTVGSESLTRKGADAIASPSRIACVKVTFMEGQFDE